MKKIIRIMIIILVLFVAWIGADRILNIKIIDYNETSNALWIKKSVWVNIPKEQWIKINHKQFKPYQAFLNVEGYHSFMNTWDNTIASQISYSYKNVGEADSKTIEITEYVKQYEFDNIHKITYEDTVDNVHILFGNFGNNEQVLQLTKNDKTVNIRFYKGHINKLKPLFECIFEDVKNS